MKPEQIEAANQKEGARRYPRPGDRWDGPGHDGYAREVYRVDPRWVYFYGREWLPFKVQRASWLRWTRNATLVNRGAA